MLLNRAAKYGKLWDLWFVPNKNVLLQYEYYIWPDCNLDNISGNGTALLSLLALLTAWVGHITFSWVCCFWLASALTVWWSSFTLTDINSTGVFLLVNSINLSIVLIPLQLQPKKKVWGIFLVERVSVGGERRRVGSRGLCAERVWESLCIPVKLQARQAPSLPFSPPPQAPLQWPSLSFQSITQPIKERELGVRLNPQHTGKNTHSHIYMHTKTSLKICI